MQADHGKQVADLQAVLEVSLELFATADLGQLVRAVERAARTVLECERATLLLYDAEAGTLRRPSADGENADHAGCLEIAHEVVQGGQAIFISDPGADPRFDAAAAASIGVELRNLGAYPLLDYGGSIVGVLQAQNMAPLDPWDEELIKVFDAQVGIALERQLLLQHYAQKQLLERDLKLARDIQQKLLPDANPLVEGFDIAGWNQPADATGGDFWDHYQVQDGALSLILADATGHGVGPALIMAACRSLWRATTSSSRDLAEVVERVNFLLEADLPDNRSVTAVLVRLEGNTLTYLSAGHGPVLRYVAAEKRIVLQEAHDIPLGIFAEHQWAAAEEFEMSRGDMMVLITDGFFEWENEQEEPFGIERVEEVLLPNTGRTAEEIIRVMYDSVVLFAGSSPQKDDLTALVVRKL